MELHSLHKTFHHSHLGEEKHQMLNLNRRLETYLSRVKHLEEENALLAEEIQALRHSNHGASTRRKGLKEELRQARLEVDAAWRDRVLTEMEVCKVAEELQALDLLRQREAQAHMQAKKKIEQSKKELEEEQRAQMWLREKVSQLENEMRHLTQTHQEDVAHLEATLNHSRATMPPTWAQRSNQTPNLLQLGQEYSQAANRAWQEAAEAHQGQLDQLEESLNQARGRLTQLNQEKSESQLKLQALEKEIASAHDVRRHLEKTAAQQGDRYNQEIQQLQEHLEGLEAEREELGRQINHITLENRGLLQQKTSLGLEVATYRALLDGEGHRGDIFLLNQPRNVSITDAVFSPRGVKKNYQTQLFAGHKTTSLSSHRGVTAITAMPSWSRKPATFTETPKIPRKPAYDDTKSTTLETPYPKILQDGAENFRPQEVQEKVTYAEPLSPPNEQEAETTSGDKEGEEGRSNAGAEPPEDKPVVESVVSYQVESGLSAEPPLRDEVDQHQFTTPNLTPYHVRMTEEQCGLSDESDKDVSSAIPAEKEDMQELQAPTEAWIEKEVEHVQEETSDSGTDAVLEPNFDSRTSSPVTECEAEESLLNRVTDFSQDENIMKEDAAEIKQEISRSVVGTSVMDVEDKLYPDGEEMDTWDSVIERKVDVKADEGIKKDEEKRQHAEPEEDISPRGQEHDKRETRQDFATDVQQDNNMASSTTDTPADDGQHDAFDQDQALLPDNQEEDDEDSQNVSMSWRTELESDSYAQDNTLADTRPLIRYKSDETDANTQASHMDESESSEGEQEKKIGEMEVWSESKSKRFGTMEDLCEEVEGEALDEEYNLGYTNTEDRDVGDVTTVREQATPLKDTEKSEETIREVREGRLDEETQELSKLTVPTPMAYDEELEIDRLVEQELENLATDYYSAFFAQQQVSKSEEHLQREFLKEMTEPEETGASSCAEPEERANHQLTSSTTILGQPHENLHFSDPSVVLPQSDTVADEVQHEVQEATDAPEKGEEEDDHNVSMVTHPDVIEDHSDFTDFISKPDMEEINNSEEEDSVLPVTADQGNLQDVAAPVEVKETVPVEASSESQECLIEDVVESHEFPETAEWEVLENPSEDFEIRDQGKDHEKCESVPQAAESCLHDDRSSDEGAMTHKEEPHEISPDSLPDETDIFVVKGSTELLNTNGKDNSLHGFISSGLKSDFWVSSLETGATYQPDDVCNEAAEQTNQNLGFADNLVWGDSENVDNWNSRVDIESSKTLTAKKEQQQTHSEVKQVLCRNEKELVHSDESEAEGESWSSGEEPI